jgi:hypothetical protein
VPQVLPIISASGCEEGQGPTDRWSRGGLSGNVTVDTDWVIWWRQSLDDGIYNVPGNVLVPSGSSQARFVGHRPGIEIRWQRDSHFYVQGDYGVFSPVRFFSRADILTI